MKNMEIKIGDIFKCPISDKEHGYGQFYFNHPEGPVVRIFNIITCEEMNPEEAVKHSLMFPPILTGLNIAIKKGIWKIVGHVEIINFEIPKFRSSLRRPDGSWSDWFIIDGDRAINVGQDLPEKYKKLEYGAVWSAIDVNERIKKHGELPDTHKWMVNV